MHAVLRERRAMRRKIVVLFVAFASVFGVVACGGQVDVKEGEIKEGVEEEVEEAKEEMKEAEQAKEEQQK